MQKAKQRARCRQWCSYLVVTAATNRSNPNATYVCTMVITTSLEVDIDNNTSSSMQPRRPDNNKPRRRFKDYVFQIIACSIIIGTVLLLSTEELARPTTINTSSESSSSQTTMSTSTSPSNNNIEYDLVLTQGPSDHPTLLRYAAKEMSKTDGSYQPVSVHRWASLLSDDSDDSNGHLHQFNDILKKTSMKAFFFETKGVTLQNSQIKPFEFVLVESDYLYNFADAQQDADTFGDHLNCVNNSDASSTTPAACVFPNLGGDSLLVAPTRLDKSANNIYGHLGAFVRRAPQSQMVATWKLVLKSYLQRLSDAPVWFSTDGTGVAWLHFRFDPSPKYYDYTEFANES